MKFLGIIPARYASTRFPAKPLAMLGGKTVIQRVYEQVAGVLDDAWVATDDERIEAAVKAFGGKVVMTSVHHKSGTDRCFEAYTKIGGDFDVVVNIQGDEPFIQPSQLETVKACFDDPKTHCYIGKALYGGRRLGGTGECQFAESGTWKEYECVVLQPFDYTLSAECGEEGLAEESCLLQTYRPVCLPGRSAERDYGFAAVVAGSGRVAGTASVAGKRLYHQGGYYECGNNRY